MFSSYVNFLCNIFFFFFFFFQAEDGIRDIGVTGVQTCALPIFRRDHGVYALGLPPDQLLEEALLVPEPGVERLLGGLGALGDLPHARSPVAALCEHREGDLKDLLPALHARPPAAGLLHLVRAQLLHNCASATSPELPRFSSLAS